MLVRAALGGALVSVVAIVGNLLETQEFGRTVRICSHNSFAHSIAGAHSARDGLREHRSPLDGPRLRRALCVYLAR
jgi:hypothetical protein